MIDQRAKERERLAAEGMYRPEFESDACGVGLVAATDGKASRTVVQAGIDALKAVWHRGAVDADGKTGDGAGLHIDLPLKFFDEAIGASGHSARPNRLAVGMMFLPRTDLGAQEACRTIVESEVISAGYTIYGWRQVPVDITVIGQKAQSLRPEIEQIMIAGPMPDAQGAAEFEKDLYLVRRRIEKRVIEAQIQGFYVCSLSCRSIIYKGLFLAESLSVFYPDLKDVRFESRVAIFHQRYSTNTFPQWWLAQPFRCLAHNGEINTIRGNKNWMISHEIKMAATAFGERSEDIKPVIPAGASDTAALDAVFEAICRSGRDAPTAKIMLVPEAWDGADNMPPAHTAMYEYLASVMEPWDGPAALAMTDGRWAVAGMDRNALRPLRYTLTNTGLLIVGSEAGMVPVPEATVIEKGRLGPGQMVAVDLDEGRVFHDREVKDRIAGEADYAEMIGGFLTVDDIALPVAETVTRYDRGELLRRQVAAGQTMEDMELILSPMVETVEGSGRIDGRRHAAGGDFRQAAADQPVLPPEFQPGHQPADRFSLRERHVMSLKTRFGNLANILDTEGGRGRVLVLDSPVLTTADWLRLKAHFGARRSGDRLHIRHRWHRGLATRRHRAHPQRSGTGGARGQERTVPDRRKGRARPHRHRRRAGRGRRPHPPRPARLAQLRQRQRPHRRMPRHPLLCGADRRRRDHRERLSGRSRHRRPPGTRPVRRAEPRPMPRQSPQGGRRRPAQDHVEDGDRGDLQLSRRL